MYDLIFWKLMSPGEKFLTILSFVLSKGVILGLKTAVIVAVALAVYGLFK